MFHSVVVRETVKKVQTNTVIYIYNALMTTEPFSHTPLKLSNFKLGTFCLLTSMLTC